MTYDPLKIIERPKAGIFSGLPSSAPGSVLVVDRTGHPLQVLAGPSDRLTAGEVRWGQIRTLFEVDVNEHPLEFEDAFPCNDDIGGFRAVVRLTCSVTDPSAVVTRGIHDVGGVLLPKVTETLRRVCGQYAAEDFQQAEVAGLAAIRSLETGPGHDAAFQISHIHVVLSLDDAAATYIRDHKEAARNLTRQQDAARLDREKAELEAELARAAEAFAHERLGLQRDRQRLEGELADQRQELELAREAARARKQQESAVDLELDRLTFEKQRQKIQAELDQQKLQLELDRAELQARYDAQVLDARLRREQMQVTQLIELLNRGQYAALAMQLAQDPAAVGPVIAQIAQQRAADTNGQLQALQLLLENDGLEGWKVTEQAKAVLRQLIGTWAGNTGQGAIAGSVAELDAGGADSPPRNAVPPAADEAVFPGDREASAADNPISSADSGS
jgi:hypothetical protein